MGFNGGAGLMVATSNAGDEAGVCASARAAAATDREAIRRMFRADMLLEAIIARKENMNIPAEYAKKDEVFPREVQDHQFYGLT